MNEELKKECIAHFAIKVKSTDGYFGKVYVWVLKNGITKINQLFLVDGDKEFPGMTKIYTKFNKSIYVVSIAFKWTTLNALHKEVFKNLVEKTTKEDKIL